MQLLEMTAILQSNVDREVAGSNRVLPWQPSRKGTYRYVLGRAKGRMLNVDRKSFWLECDYVQYRILYLY